MTSESEARLAALEKKVALIEEALTALHETLTVTGEALFGPGDAALPITTDGSFSFTKEVDPLEARHLQVAVRAKAFLSEEDD